MIHHDHILNFAVIRLENGDNVCFQTQMSFEEITREFKTETELKNSTIINITVYPYSKEVEREYKN